MIKIEILQKKGSDRDAEIAIIGDEPTDVEHDVLAKLLRVIEHDDGFIVDSVASGEHAKQAVKDYEYRKKKRNFEVMDGGLNGDKE